MFRPGMLQIGVACHRDPLDALNGPRVERIGQHGLVVMFMAPIMSYCDAGEPNIISLPRCPKSFRYIIVSFSETSKARQLH